MKTPLQITYRHMETSQALNQFIEKEVAKLEEFSDHITECRVVIEEPHQKHHASKHFAVHVTMLVKGAELVADRDPEDFREDPYKVVRDSFQAVRRQLQDHVQVARRDVKRHSQPSGGEVEG